MTTEQQRIAIAEWCGWKLIDDKTTGRNPSRSFDHYQKHGNESIPDYLSDLNAMHEAEGRLENKLWDTYVNHVVRIVSQRWSGGVCNNSPIHATAAQRAEALLRTIGKWEDDK